MTVTENQNDTKHDDINIAFKIPICYNENVQKLNENVITDLELVNSIDNSESSIYETVFKPSNNTSSQVITQISQYYTTDIDYLRETQQLTKNINSAELNTIHNTYNFSDFDIPKDVHNYLHRIGRSGRWGRKGTGINFITRRDIHKMKEIEQYYSTQIEELPSGFNIS